MRGCPCCLQAVAPWAPAGRPLAGRCDVCRARVCSGCLAPAPRGAGRMCRACLYDVMAERGYRPSFPEPAGRRARAERAARPPCGHGRVRRWMGFCPDCGEEVPWEAEHGNPSCEECGAPSHEAFNACWACGESFDEDNPVAPAAEGYALDFDCAPEEGEEGCGGGVAWLMSHCPWCARPQTWHFAPAPHEDPRCEGCDQPCDAAWAYCALCGTEAPPDVAAPPPPPPEPPTPGPAAHPHAHAHSHAPPHAPHPPGPGHARAGAAAGDGAGAAAPGGGAASSPGASGTGASAGAPSGSTSSPGAAPGGGSSGGGSSGQAGRAGRAGTEGASAEPGGPGAPAGDAGPSAGGAAGEAHGRPPATPWEVLGVAPGTPLAEVRRAYLGLVAQYHPDKVAQLGPKLQAVALEETRRLNAAWEQLRHAAR